MSTWFVYVVRCADDSLYTGITTDIDRRIQEHNRATGKGAKYTRQRQPVVLVYSEQIDSRAAATRRELVIKRLSRAEKMRLISQTSKETLNNSEVPVVLE